MAIAASAPVLPNQKKQCCKSPNSLTQPVLLRIKEQKIILHEIRKRKANWIGHILRRNCLLQRITEGKIKGGIEVTGRRGRKRRKLLDDLNPLNAQLNPICHLLELLGAHPILHISRIRVKEMREYSHLKEEALDRTMWRAHFGRGFEPVVKQTAV
jgi:hypothetical protein